MQVWTINMIFHSLGRFPNSMTEDCACAQLKYVLLERLKVDNYPKNITMQLKVINMHFLSIRQLENACIYCTSRILFSESLSQNTDIKILTQCKFNRPKC